VLGKKEELMKNEELKKKCGVLVSLKALSNQRR